MSFPPIGDEKHLCLDGKTMRGVKKLDFEHSAHIVSAYNPAEMASVAQVYLDSKSNEINGIKLLLEQLNLSDTLVSIDAIGTQSCRTGVSKHECMSLSQNLFRLKAIRYWSAGRA